MRRVRAKRSAAMQQVLQCLAAKDRSAAWLGRNLKPRISRQTIAEWRDVPEQHVAQVAELVGMSRRQVRPDLAALFDEDEPCKAA